MFLALPPLVAVGLVVAGASAGVRRLRQKR
jgi:hypothetical protein